MPIMSALQNAGSIVEYSSPNTLSPTSALSVGEWSANLPLSGYERIVRHWFTMRALWLKARTQLMDD
jgi:hypothetical protein